MKLTQNNTALLVAPKQPPQVITIPHDDLERIIFRGERLIEQTQQQPFFKNKSRYQVINTLISQAKLERDYIRLSILYFARTAYVSQPKLDKWGIVKVAISADMWGYELLANWTKPTTAKGKFKTTQATKKTRQKTVNNDNETALTEQAIKAMTAFCYYTHLRQTNPNFNPPKLNNDKGLSLKNSDEVLSQFNDYLDYENQTIANLEKSTNIDFKYYNFVQSKAPTDHRTKSCRSGDTQYYYNKKTQKVTPYNDNPCNDPMCSYCNHSVWGKREQLASQVDKIHYANGGESLQLTLAPPPHTLKTKVADQKELMNKVYEGFNRKAMRLIKTYGYHGKLKRLDPLYSVNNGSHVHAHVAYAIDQISDSQLAELTEQLTDLYLDCLIEHKGIKKKDRQTLKNKGVLLDLRKNPHAFQYVAKCHKSSFTLADIPSLLAKSKVKALTVHELGYLALHGYIKEPFFERVYQEILTAFYETTQLKYSPMFLEKLGLKAYKPKGDIKPFQPLKAISATLAPPSDQTPQNPPIFEPQCDQKGQMLMDLQPPMNDSNQFLLFDRIEPPKPPKQRKERSDKGKPRTKPTATTTANAKGQYTLFKGDYVSYYPTIPPKSRKHLVHLSTLTYEQQTALEQARAVGLYTGMLKHAYEKGYFKNNVPFS